jgi:hypothetical protein
VAERSGEEEEEEEDLFVFGSRALEEDAGSSFGGTEKCSLSVSFSYCHGLRADRAWRARWAP